ncbi:hypothetical protein H0H87_008529 [Tephrocybe sp. NHM501043]|nr:hypothetical protein H0H87_008529 [Tephrocybe sp. NHM501043]
MFDPSCPESSEAPLDTALASPTATGSSLREGRTLSTRRSSNGNIDDQTWLKPQGSKNSSSPHLSRSGLLQPRLYNQPNGFVGSYDNHATLGPYHSNSPHSQNTIRESTMELSSISFSSTSPIMSMNSSGEYTSPSAIIHEPSLVVTTPLLSQQSNVNGGTTPRLPLQPSGLSLLRHEYETGSNSGSEGSRTPTAAPKSVPTPPPTVHWPDACKTTSTASATPVTVTPFPPPAMTETTPLIRRTPSSPIVSHTTGSHHNAKPLHTTMGSIVDSIPQTMGIAFKSIPAVLLGCLLNILDGVSYGMIIFPGTGVFSELGPMGVSMFFLSATLAQTVYTLGGSGFAGANGSMMIEVVPFFHILANEIASHIGESNPKEVISTTLAAYTLSSILTGTHILVGCIGGVGAFLIQTGFTVSMRISEDDLGADWKTIEMMFLDKHNLILWLVPLILAVILRPVLFYVVVAGLGLDLWDLRRTGWIFDMGAGGSEAWYKFYSYWAVSLNEDIDTDKELVSHGYSNLLSGLFGTVGGAFAHSIQEKQQCQQFVDQVSSGPIFEKSQNKRQFLRCKVSMLARKIDLCLIFRYQLGFLFFGTITHVEDAIRDIVDGPAWHNNPVRFLVLDLTLVAGVDMSSSEAFVRMHRFLSAKSVTMVFCGFSGDSAVAGALKSVHVLGADDVEHFLTFNDVMEWTENAYLRAWYMAQKYEVTSTAFALPGRHHREYDHASEQHSLDSFVSSPRRSYMRDVGNRTIANENHRATADSEECLNEPQNTLIKAFSSYGDLDIDLFRPIGNYLERMSLPEGFVLWRQGDPSDGLYIVEAGILRASYKFADHLQHIEESMVPGTLAGELSALSALPRNATVVIERPAVLWKLSTQKLARLEVEEPKLARYFLRLILKGAVLPIQEISSTDSSA